MARTDYGAILSTVITGTSQSIRNKEGTTDLIAPVNWSREISRMNHSLVDTTSGSICSFYDGADNVPIKLLQASVSGTGCNVKRTNETAITISGGQVGKWRSSNGAVQTDAKGYLSPFNAIPDGDFLQVKGTENLSSLSVIIVSFFNSSNTFISRTRVEGTTLTVTIPNNSAYFEVGLFSSSTMTESLALSFDVKAYKGTTYPISWSTEVGTVTSGTMQVNADGTIDVTSGGTTTRLTSTVDIRTLLGTNNIYCDTGDISALTYYMDMDLYIQNGLIEETVASAPVASFSDGMKAYPLKELSLAINPTQAGSGDPAPDNIRPITGVSSVDVFRMGKNLSPTQPINYTATNYGVILFWVKAGTYTASYTGGNCQFYVRASSPTDTTITSGTEISHSTTYRNDYTFTVPSDGYYKVQLYRSSGSPWSAVDAPTNFQIESGNQASDYSPYQGNTYTIDLDGTRYGGTIDIVDGEAVMTVTHVDVDMGTMNWSFITDRGWSTTDLIGVAVLDYNNPSFIAEQWRTHGWTGRANGDIVCNSGGAVFCVTTDNVNQPQGKMVYELATPIEIDLTPTQINSLLGQNNIWHDGNGETSCTYYANGQLYVDQHNT